MELDNTELAYWRINDTYVSLSEHLHFKFTPRDFAYLINKDFIRNSRGEVDVDLLLDTEFHINTPKGFVSDLASIPKWLQWLFKPDGKWAKAAALHDFLYALMPYEKGYTGYWRTHKSTTKNKLMLSKLDSRKVIDSIFYIAMRKSDVNPVIAFAFYSMVRLFGGKYFRTDVPIDVITLLKEDTELQYFTDRSIEPHPIFTKEPIEYVLPTVEKDSDCMVLTISNLPTPLLLLSA